MKTMDYVKETQQAYKDTQRARRYKEQQTQGGSWSRLTTLRERLCVAKALKSCSLRSENRILDIPCGSGILGKILGRFPFNAAASDISREMMELAWTEFDNPHFLGFAQADITQPPFPDHSFACVITVGLMHRLPGEIHEEVLKAIANLTSRFIIISYSLTSFWQRQKQRFIRTIKRQHMAAPAPLPLDIIKSRLEAQGLRILKKFWVIPLLSSEVIFLLEKRHPR